MCRGIYGDSEEAPASNQLSYGRKSLVNLSVARFSINESYSIAMARLCSVHNMVNVRLGKAEFDCSKLDETYDCGCDDSSSDLLAATTTEDHEPGMIKGGR
jgi:hypothetical protein